MAARTNTVRSTPPLSRRGTMRRSTLACCACVALLLLAQPADAAPPTFQQIQALAAVESTPGAVTVPNFVTAILDGDMGGDGFTGTAADARLVNFMPNANMFAAPPTLSLTRAACDPLPGCALTLTYTLAPFASGAVTFQVQVTDAAGEVGALVTTTLTVAEVNNAPQPALASATGTAGNPLTVLENAGAQAGLALLAAPIPVGPPQAVNGPAPFGGEAMQTIRSVVCVATDPTLFAVAMGSAPVVDPTTGQVSFTPQRNRVGTTEVRCEVRDSADDPASTADDAQFSFFIRVAAGQDCAEGEAGARACDGATQTCFDDGMPDGDNMLNNNFVCVCNNGGQRAARQAAPSCDDCAVGAAGAMICADAVMPARWYCFDADPSPGAQGTFTCRCENGGGEGTPPARCDDCAVNATGALACAPTAYCLDPDRGDPAQQKAFQCVCINNANRAAPTANAPPAMGDCDDCATLPCGTAGQTCTDPDMGSPTSQGNHLCTCNNQGGAAVGRPASVCDDCAGNPAVCGPRQQCVDPDTAADRQGDYLCRCENGGGQGVGAPALVCDDCSSLVSPCGANSSQICRDPNLAPTQQLDFTCTCNTGVDYTRMGAIPAAGTVSGQAASCPVPPRFTPGGEIRVTEELMQVYSRQADRWVPGPGLAAGYNAAWATGVSDAEGPGFADSGTQARVFKLRHLSGSGAGAAASGTDAFSAGGQPFVDSAGRLTFMPKPDAWGTVTYEVLLLDSGNPSGVPAPAPGEVCPAQDVWCTSTPGTLTISIVPENDPPSFNCTNTSIVVWEDVGPVVLPNWALNVSAGPFEPLQNLEFKVFTDNEGLFATKPYVEYTQGSTYGNLRFEPLRDAEGVATVDVQLWDSGQDVGGAIQRRVGKCSVLRIEVRNVNDRPTFTHKGAVTLVEDSPPFVFERWATEISAGAWSGARGHQSTDEQDRKVFFLVNYTNPDDWRRFATPPRIDPQSGDLTIHPAKDQNTFGGPVVLNVTLVDSAGLHSEPYLLSVTILPVDDPPTFTAGPSVITVHEDSPPYVQAWATDVAPGPLFEGAGPTPAYENQTTYFVIRVAQSDRSLFTPNGAPTITPDGVLRFTLAPDAYGTASLSITAADKDPLTGVALEGQTSGLVINVLPVNDPPQISTFRDTVVVEKGSPPHSIARFITGLVPGPDNERLETLSFDVFTNDTHLFAPGGEPRLVYNGGSFADFQFTPAADTTGVANVTIRVMDNGGIARGGQDTTVAYVTIVVTNVNNPPSFARGSDITVLEDQCNFPTPCDFSNWATQVTPGLGEKPTQHAYFELRPFNDAIFMQPEPQVSLPFPPWIGYERSMGITGHNKTLYNKFSDPIAPIKQQYILPGRLWLYTRPNVSGASLVASKLIDDGAGLTLPVKESASRTFTVRILPVNDPPSFEPGPQVYLDECVSADVASAACAYSFPGWAKRISPGPPDESAQRVLFQVETNQAAMFRRPPTIDGVTGTLSFELNPYANTGGRSVTLLITACDTGGRLNGGIDCTRQTFNLSIGTVDSPARFIAGEDIVAIEDEGLVRRLFWARNATLGRTDGRPNTGLAVVQCVADNPMLFASGPNVTLPQGDLYFVSAPDQWGQSLVTCPFGNDTASRAQFVVTVLSVNDRPEFKLRNLSIPISSASGGGPVLVTTDGNTTAVFDPNLFWAQGVAATDTNGAPFPGVIPGTNRVAGRAGSYGVVPRFSGNYVVTGRDLVVLENWDGQHPGYVVRYLEPTSISVGPPDEEAEQTYTFDVQCTGYGEVFSRPPEVTSSGLLSFHLRPRKSGTVGCKIYMLDDGGTERGGIRRSAPLSFSLVVLDVDSPPEFVRGPNIVVKEDHAPYSKPWAAAVTAGSEDELQNVQLHANVSDLQAYLFATPVSFSPWPTPSVLNFHAAPDQFGVVNAVVYATDTGGARSEVSTFTVTILPVNDPPTFTLLAPRVAVQEDSPLYNAPFVVQIVPGPTNEADQMLRWEVTPLGDAQRTTWGSSAVRRSTALQQTDVPGGLFLEHPRILHPVPFSGASVSGTGASQNLTFRLAPDAWGSQEFQACLIDDGGVANGGSDRTCRRFFVDVTSVNDPPRAVTSGVIELHEDAGEVTVARWLSIIQAGPLDESRETVRVLGTNCPSTPQTALFAAPPVTHHPSGDVRFSLLPDAFGEINCTVAVQDSGGVVAQIPMHVVVRPVNDAPTFTAVSEVIEWNEDGGAFRRVHAVGLSPGPENERGQRVIFTVNPVAGRLPPPQPRPGSSAAQPTVNAGEAYRTLFADGVSILQDSVDPTKGILSFVPRKDAYGEVTLDIVVGDDGAPPPSSADGGAAAREGAAFRTARLTVRILPVNDPPVFTYVNGTIFLTEDAGGMGSPRVVTAPSGSSGGDASPQLDASGIPSGSVVVQGWAFSVSPGPSNEGGQTVRFVILWPTTGSSMFFAPPEVDARTGDLVLPLKADAFGEVTLTIKAVDDGGRARGGIDESADKRVRIVLAAVNDAPFLVWGSAKDGNKVRVLEDVPETVPNFASRIHPGKGEELVQVAQVVSSGAGDTTLLEMLQFYPDGALSVVPRKDRNGVTQGWIELRDNGGRANGGTDTKMEQVTVEVVPVNDPPTFRLKKLDVHVSEDCGMAWIDDLVTDVSPGPTDEAWQVVHFRPTVATPELFRTTPSMDPFGKLGFNFRPDWNGVASVQVQACDTGGEENGGIPCSAFQELRIHVDPVNDAPTFVPGEAALTVSSNAGTYAEQWATQVSAGPADEEQGGLRFVTTAVSNAELFLADGAPVVRPDGVMVFSLNNKKAGNTTVAFRLEDSAGARSPEYLVRIESLDPSEAPLVAVLDELYENFNLRGFRQAVGRAMEVSEECVVVLRTQPATVRVNFRFTRVCGRYSASYLNQRYLAAVSDAASPLRLELRLLESYSEGVHNTQLNQENLKLLRNGNMLPNGEYAADKSTAGNNNSTLVVVLVVCLLALCVATVAAVWCLRRYLRRRRWEADNATYEKSRQQQAFEEEEAELAASGRSGVVADGITGPVDPDLLAAAADANPHDGVVDVTRFSPRRHPALRAYHDGGASVADSSAASHVSNTTHLFHAPPLPPPPPPPPPPQLQQQQWLQSYGDAASASANPIDATFSQGTPCASSGSGGSAGGAGGSADGLLGRTRAGPGHPASVRAAAASAARPLSSYSPSNANVAASAGTTAALAGSRRKTGAPPPAPTTAALPQEPVPMGSVTTNPLQATFEAPAPAQRRAAPPSAVSTMRGLAATPTDAATASVSRMRYRHSNPEGGGYDCDDIVVEEDSCSGDDVDCCGSASPGRGPVGNVDGDDDDDDIDLRFVRTPSEDAVATGYADARIVVESSPL